MSRRRVRHGQTTSMNRLYAIEAGITNTGSVADHRMSVKPSQIEAVAWQILRGQPSNPILKALLEDLNANRGASVVIAGEEQPPVVHAIAHALNSHYGNIGTTVLVTDPVEVAPANQLASLMELVRDMNAGAVKALIILGGTPVFDAPVDLQFKEALDEVPFRAHHSLYDDETSLRCHWHVPDSHWLENWSDARAHDGTVSIVQPLISPLYNGRSVHEVLGALIGGLDQTPYQTVRTYWFSKGANEQTWRKWLHDGVVENSALPTRAAVAAPPTAQPSNRATEGIEIELRPDPNFRYGRTNAGKVGSGVGFNTYPFRFSNALHGGGGATIKIDEGMPVYPIGCVQEHQSIDPRDVGERGIIRAATFAEYLKNPHFAQEEEHGVEAEAEHANTSMYPPHDYSKGHAWAMVIDNSVCIGCNGCVIACQSENNIAVVGKEQVVRERELHWLRIDRYYRGDVNNPEVFHEPVPCMQCENAPCEPVCPVEATSHSDEGLNDMTYNRCIGTRYCSNNCPYKVRRFNFFHYADYDTPALKPMRNPDVTVRTRGVMEKCTYCVQRINQAKIDAEKENGNQRVRDGEVTTACAQACPTEAIVFGDMNDKT